MSRVYLPKAFPALREAAIQFQNDVTALSKPEITELLRFQAEASAVIQASRSLYGAKIRVTFDASIEKRLSMEHSLFLDRL